MIRIEGDRMSMEHPRLKKKVLSMREPGYASLTSYVQCDGTWRACPKHILIFMIIVFEYKAMLSSLIYCEAT